jgi:hypothetical protein
VVNVYVGETKVLEEFSPLIRKLYRVFAVSDVSETLVAITSAPANVGVVGAAI